jgi:hypothetical protein
LPSHISIKKNGLDIEIEIRQDPQNVFFYPKFFYNKQIIDIEDASNFFESTLLIEFDTYLNQFKPYIEMNIIKIIKSTFIIDKDIFLSLFRKNKNFLDTFYLINVFTIYSYKGTELVLRTTKNSNQYINLYPHVSIKPIIFANKIHGKNFLLLKPYFALQMQMASQVVGVMTIAIRISVIIYWVIGNIVLSTSDSDLFSSLSDFVRSGDFYDLIISLINVVIPAIVIKFVPSLIRLSIRLRLKKLFGVS